MAGSPKKRARLLQSRKPETYLLRSEVRLLLAALNPPPNMTVSEWADAERVISSEHAASPGKWRTEKAEYLRGIMDAISDKRVETVVIEGCSQHGKTEFILNAVGYHMQHDPAPMLVVQPTLTIAEAFSKDRLAPMIRDTPSLTALVQDPRTRDSGNTVLHKQFHGGQVTIAGANSPASLASRPVRLVFCDEIDRYVASAGTEGDPVDLAFKRAKSFWNRKRILTSSPTRKTGRIHQAFAKSDRRYYLVRCPHCGIEQRLYWNPLSDDEQAKSRVRWSEGDPSTARYYCVDCNKPWEEMDRIAAIRSGRWQAEGKLRKTAGFWVGALMLTWQSVEEHVREWLDVEASGNVERKRVFANTEVGDTFDDEGEHLSDESLRSRVEQWSGVPPEVMLTTAGADVQADRIELELVGWGDRERSWSLDYKIFHGDPASPEVWADLDAYLLEKKPASVCIDSGGHHTENVYRFCSSRLNRRVFAIKGAAGAGRLVWPRAPSRGKGGHRVYIVGVDSVKDIVFSNFKVTKPESAGYCHMPSGREEWWYGGLTSESVFDKHTKGIPVREYRRRPGFRNEPLDCRVYAYAALCSFGKISWGAIAKRRSKAIAQEATSPSVAPEASAVLTPSAIGRRAQRRARGMTRGWARSW